jgi:hypothetical protein
MHLRGYSDAGLSPCSFTLSLNLSGFSDRLHRVDDRGYCVHLVPEGLSWANETDDHQNRRATQYLPMSHDLTGSVSGLPTYFPFNYVCNSFPFVCALPKQSLWSTNDLGFATKQLAETGL